MPEQGRSAGPTRSTATRSRSSCSRPTADVTAPETLRWSYFNGAAALRVRRGRRLRIARHLHGPSVAQGPLIRPPSWSLGVAAELAGPDAVGALPSGDRADRCSRSAPARAWLIGRHDTAGGARARSPRRVVRRHARGQRGRGARLLGSACVLAYRGPLLHLLLGVTLAGRRGDGARRSACGRLRSCPVPVDGRGRRARRRARRGASTPRRSRPAPRAARPPPPPRPRSRVVWVSRVAFGRPHCAARCSMTSSCSSRPPSGCPPRMRPLGRSGRQAGS